MIEFQNQSFQQFPIRVRVVHTVPYLESEIDGDQCDVWCQHDDTSEFWFCLLYTHVQAGEPQEG